MSGRVFALIPAAGHSVRMGQPKLSLPLHGRPVLDWVIAAFRAARVERVLVVVGPHVAELAELAQRAGATALVLPEATPDMRTTVLHGLAWLEEQEHPEPDDAWLLAPADHPTLRANVVVALLQTWREQPESGIIIPTCNGRRGHPALVRWSHVAGLHLLPPDQGLNMYFRQHHSETLELPLSEPGILCDLDTPEDYQRLQAQIVE